MEHVRDWLANYFDGLAAAGCALSTGTAASRKDVPYSVRRWRQLTSGLLAGTLPAFVLGIRSRSGVRLGRLLWGVWARGAAGRSVAEISLARTFVDGESPSAADFVAECVNLCDAEGFSQARFVTPGLPRDLRFTQTPLELRHPFGPEALSWYLRGLGWGLWLGEPLIKRLGGWEAARRVPVHRVLEQSNGVWLELGSSLSAAVTDAQIEAASVALAPLMPTVRDVIAADRTEEDERRLRAARLVNSTLPFAFAVEGIFTHPDGAMVRGVVTHGAIPPFGTPLKVCLDGVTLRSAVLIQSEELDMEPLVMLRLRGVDARDVPPGSRFCTDERVLKIPAPKGLVREE